MRILWLLLACATAEVDSTTDEIPLFEAEPTTDAGPTDSDPNPPGGTCETSDDCAPEDCHPEAIGCVCFEERCTASCEEDADCPEKNGEVVECLVEEGACAHGKPPE